MAKNFTFQSAEEMVGANHYTPNKAVANSKIKGPAISGSNNAKKTSVSRPDVYKVPQPSERAF